MSEIDNKTFLYNYKFRVIFTWVWFFIGSLIVILIFFIIKNFNIEETLAILNNERHLMVFIEFSSVGFMPLLITIMCKDNLGLYGVNKVKRNILKSIVTSVLMIAIMYSIGYLLNGVIIKYESYDFGLEIPWNIIFGIISVFTWGPLEVFFYIWLLTNTDMIFDERNKLFSKGLIITTIVFAAVHILTTNVLNVFYVGGIFLVLGLIYKYSNNILGPAIAWTMINGTIWFVSQMFWV